MSGSAASRDGSKEKGPLGAELLGATFHSSQGIKPSPLGAKVAKEADVVQPVLLARLAHHIGEPRFATYLAHSKNHAGQALDLYRWNMEMSGALAEALSVAEVFLRNAVDRELRVWNARQPERVTASDRTSYTHEWVESPAGPLWAILNPRRRGGTRYSTYEDARQRAQNDLDIRVAGHRRHGHPVDHDDVVAHMTFGTWKKILPKPDANHPSGYGSAGQRRLWDEALHLGFPYKPQPTVIHYWVDRLHSLRNRVAHLEPLCDIDVMSYHRTISRLLKAIEPTVGDWYTGISRVPEVARRKPAP